MIKQKTVFIVGAGASYELRFPLGDELLPQIASALDFKVEYEITGGSKEIRRALYDASTRGPHKLNDYVIAAHRVRDAAHLGLSIDNVVHQQYSDSNFVQMAKLGIAFQLLSAEQASDLCSHPDPNSITWPKVRGTWLGRFAQMLVQDLNRSSIEKIFDNVSVISFNYDRSIRRFMPIVLKTQFSISDNEAFEISRKLKILHPYGSLGPLPWENAENSVEFGHPDRANLWNVASNIRTFTEQSNEGGAVEEIRDEICSAHRLVFLGFGYISQNMQLIAENFNSNAQDVMGTIYGLSDPDAEVVSNQLRGYFNPNERGFRSPRMVNAKCEEFLRKHFRTITS